MHNFRNSLHRLKRSIPSFIDGSLSALIDPKDSIVITGFWRSGTTWLQRIIADNLRAKSIFEPLEVDVIHRYQLDISRLPSQSDLYLKAHMPFEDEIISRESTLYSLLSDSLKGKIIGKRVRSNRTQVSEMWRKHVIVKFVRGHLLVRGIFNTFSPTIIHIYRDPRAVIASISRANWGGAWLSSLSLSDQLLKPSDNRVNYFQTWSDEIMYFEKRSVLEKVALYWALLEKYVENCHFRYQSPQIIVRYESLVKGRWENISDLRTLLGQNQHEKYIFSHEQNSTTTIPSRLNISSEDRLYGWKQELPSNVIQNIVDIAQRFDFTDRLFGR